MNDKKYYWMKTKQDFYDRDEIRYIENMKNGDTIIKLYQKLCLTSLNKEGKLIFQLGSKIIPYTEEQLATECRTTTNMMNTALTALLEVGLIECNDNIYSIVDFEEMVGCESKWAEKKRNYRAKIKGQKEGQDEGLLDGLSKDIVLEDNRDKILEFREEIKENKERKRISDSVSVSEAELEDFFDGFDIRDIYDQNQIITYLNNGMQMEVLKNALMLPFNRNVEGYDFDTEQVPIEKPIEYGLKVLENWNAMGVRTLSEAKKFNKIISNPNRRW